MKSPSALILLTLLFLLFSGCQRPSQAESKPKSEPAVAAPDTPAVVEIKDECYQERAAFRLSTRNLYNNRQFAQLEELANELHTSKAVFDNGSWKIIHFYDCQSPGDDDSESLWKLHDQIHKEWIAVYPQSMTARVAYANFLIDYAWNARGGGYADTVSEKGWHLFGERIKAALAVLDESAALQPPCPVWWRLRMVVAKAQGWQPQVFHKLFEQAKAVEPAFWGFETTQANYLLPRWHGAPGEWEYVASTEAKRPGSLGLEGYARTVMSQSDYYDNIFKKSNASWPDTREGCAQLLKKYPHSLELVAQFCKLACVAADRATARQLFEELNGRMDLEIWINRDYFIGSQNWAFSK